MNIFLTIVFEKVLLTKLMYYTRNHSIEVLLLFFKSSNAKVSNIKHYKKLEQTVIELRTTEQIDLFKTTIHGGITFHSSNGVTITMRWYKEGPPSASDIEIELTGTISVGTYDKTIHVSYSAEM